MRGTTRTTITEEIGNIYFSEGFQAEPARPSDKGKLETK